MSWRCHTPPTFPTALRAVCCSFSCWHWTPTPASRAPLRHKLGLGHSRYPDEGFTLYLQEHWTVEICQPRHYQTPHLPGKSPALQALQYISTFHRCQGDWATLRGEHGRLPCAPFGCKPQRARAAPSVSHTTGRTSCIEEPHTSFSGDILRGDNCWCVTLQSQTPPCWLWSRTDCLAGRDNLPLCDSTGYSTSNWCSKPMTSPPPSETDKAQSNAVRPTQSYRFDGFNSLLSCQPCLSLRLSSHLQNTKFAAPSFCSWYTGTPAHFHNAY